MSKLNPWEFVEHYNLAKKVKPIAIWVGMFAFAAIFFTEAVAFVLGLLVLAAPVWLPIVLFLLFKRYWMRYILTKKFLETDNTVIEIRLPREIDKSPLAMETITNAFFHTGEPSNLVKKYFKGETNPQFSLEITSFEGDVRFYIHLRRKHRALVEAEIYSQYPGVEIYEAPDYMNRFTFDLNKINVFGLEFTLREPDPLPIKTYVDFGLEKDPKEEYKVDPLANLLEFFGSMGPGENALMQIIVKSHDLNNPDFPKKWKWYNPATWIDANAKLFKPSTWFTFAQVQSWQDIAKQQMQKVIDELKTDSQGWVTYRPPTEDQKMLLESMGRNIAKKPFRTGIRMLYIADKDKYRSERHSAFPTVFRTFESHLLNGFKPKFITQIGEYTQFSDPQGKRAALRKEYLFESYRLRSMLTPPYKSPYTFILSSEELATIYHFPSRAVTTPGIARVPAKKSEAPPNLPM